MEPIAEIIETNTRSFTAEVYRTATPPDFGCWVTVPHTNGTTLFGLVSHVEIGSLEPNRRAVAMGRTTDELRREMPHVLELLRTSFRAQVLAYQRTDGAVRQTLPPQPAPVHGFVSTCAPEIVQQIGAPFDFLRTLVRNPDPAVPVDDLVVAVLSQLMAAQSHAPDADATLIAAGRSLSRLMNDDHERLESILRRVQR
ncbi:MAG: hypothetical protein RhofKO_10410 [Rhodothermales bacterium]